jgi:integrase
MGDPAENQLSAAESRRVTARNRATVRANRLWEELLTQKAPDLVAEKSGAGLTRKVCEAIWLAVQEEEPTADLLRVRQAFRGRLKDLAAKTDGAVVMPPPLSIIRRDKSPFADDATALSTKLNLLLSAFHGDLKNGMEFDDKAARFESLVKRYKHQAPEAVIARRQQTLAIGRIVFSAIVNGGMLLRKHYRKLPLMLCDQLQAHGDYAWLSIPLKTTDSEEQDENTDDPDQPIRRWILDPVTLGLVTRWRLDQPIDECRRAAKQITATDSLKAYLSYLHSRAGQESGEAPRLTIPMLFDAARARLSLYLPQVLVRFLAYTSDGSSMSERSWWRFTCDLQIQYTSTRAEEEESGQAIVDAESIDKEFVGDKVHFFSAQESFITLLNQSLVDPANSEKFQENHLAAKEITEILKARASDMAPIIKAWYLWILWKLTRASRAQGRIVTSSAKRYTSRLGSMLVEVGAEMFIEGTSAADWEEFYQDVLDALDNDDERAAAVGNLQQFHQFLMVSFDVPPAVIAGQISTGSRPRVSLVTEKDYQRLMKALGKAEGERIPHQYRMLRLVAMLMFRIGLRPGEILSLKYKLIHGVSRESVNNGTADPILYLKVTTGAKLKSSSAVRQIPLNWFLTTDELKEFTEYLARRERTYRDGNTDNMLILSTTLNNNESLNQKETLGKLTELLRSITGDPAIVAYALRHSCLTHLFAALFMPESPFLRNGNLPREAIYSISTMAGHLDPVITLQFYIHLQDWIAHRMLGDEQEDLPLAIWSTLANIGYKSLEQRRRRRAQDGDKAPQWLDFSRQAIRKLKCPLPETRSGENVEIPTLDFQERTLLDLDMDDINALLLSGHRRHHDQARAEIFDLPVEQIRKFFKHSKILAGEVSEAYSENKRFRNLKIKDYVQMPEIFRRPQPGRLGPAPPNTRRERAEADRIYRLLGKRANELNLQPEVVKYAILDPVGDLLAAQARSESVIRATDAEQFAGYIRILRELHIDQGRIEIEIESLPLSKPVDNEHWFNHLRRLAGSRKLRAATGHENLTRRSRHYPDFGIAKIRVLELATPLAGELKTEARARVGSRAGAGWRVGCFYACVALAALIDLPFDWFSMGKTES